MPIQSYITLVRARANPTGAPRRRQQIGSGARTNRNALCLDAQGTGPAKIDRRRRLADSKTKDAKVEPTPIARRCSIPPCRVPGGLIAKCWSTAPTAPGVVAPNIDKSELSHPEPRRIRDREHVRFVTKHPCLICGRTPSDPHHLRFAQHRVLGRKVSDEFTVPLCRGHHRQVHRCGDEAAWCEYRNMRRNPLSP